MKNIYQILFSNKAYAADVYSAIKDLEKYDPNYKTRDIGAIAMLDKVDMTALKLAHPTIIFKEL